MSILDPDVLASIATEVASQPREEMLPELVRRLRERYGDHIIADPKWHYSLTGGATGVVAILHASLSEYLVVFGSPLGTEGFSGRYTVDIIDWVLSGELWNFGIEDPLHRVVTRAGESRNLIRGDASGFRLLPDGWLLEYGRGNVPLSLPHVLADAAFRGLDPLTIVETLRSFGTAAARELLRRKRED